MGIPWRGRIAGVAVLALAGCGGGGGDARVFEFLDGDLARLAEPCDAKSVMFSSFDRTGKNDDGFSGLFSRLRIDDNGEHVLAEMDGPGCLKRIWMTWPGRSTRVRIYIDGRADPVLDLPTEELFSGARPPFLAPFVGGDREFGGINFSYVPVPFAKSIRVTTVDPIRFYQINAAAYPAGTEIESFSFPASRSFARRIEEARRAIAALPDTVTLDMPWTSPMRPGDEVIEFTDSLPYEIRAHAPRPALVIDRAGEIVEMRIGLEEPGAAWRVVRLLVRWDGEEHPSIAAPLSDLFGSAFRSVRVRSAAMLASSCTGVLRLPMPFESARIELRRTWMDGPARARVRVLFRPRDVGPEEGRLHATSSDWRADAPDSLGAGVPYLASPEHTVVRARGRGHFVGTLLSARGGATHSFLEGDETVVVDGDLRNALRGTGTEDYFNSGWYFSGPRADLPFSGIPFKREDPAPRLSAYRWHLADRIAFEDSLEVRFEIGDGAIEPGTEYSTVAVWYQLGPGGRGEAREDARGYLPRGVAYPRHMVRFADPKEDAGQEEHEAVLDTRGWYGRAFAWSWRPAPLALNSGVAWYEPGKNAPRAYPSSRARARLLLPPEGIPEGRYDVCLVYAVGPGLGTIRASLGGRTLLDRVDCAADTLSPVVLGPPLRMTLGEGDLAIDFDIEPALPDSAEMEAVRSNRTAAEIASDLRGQPLGTRKLTGLVSGILLTPTEPPIDRWLVVGPFDDPACTRFDSAFAPEQEHARGGIDRGATYAGIGGAVIRWKEARADPSGFVDLRRAIGPGTHRIAYAATWVKSPRARAALFSFGSDDGAKVWLNGKRIHRWPVHRAWQDDQDRFTGELKAGWNEVFVQVEQGIAGWGFSLRLSDARGELVSSLVPE